MRVVVIGTGPWPLESDAIVTGPSIRLRQFVQPLLLAKHEVIVILLEDGRRKLVPIQNTRTAEAFGPEDIGSPEVLAKEVDLNFVGAVFGVGSLLPAVAATRLARHLKVPAWVDLFGDPLAELHAAQLRQGGKPDTMARDHVWKLMREALLHGDSFSSVSDPQRHALLGQLGLLGRYANDWEVSKRIHEIPCAVPDHWVADQGRAPFPSILRRYNLSEESKYCFFGGSWNVWLDEINMARAIGQALRIDNDLKFVCCGIPTGPAGEQIHQSLMRDLKEFENTGRIIELPPQHIDKESELLSWAGACISLDRPIPEAELGSRNRLLAMVRHGARPVVSVEAGIEMELVAEGLASGILDGNWDRAGKEIVRACDRSEREREQDRILGLEWLRKVTFGETLKPAIQWIAKSAPRWPAPQEEGLVDKWAAFPADSEILFGQKEKKKSWFFS